jgi:hypothetical protein
MATVFLHPGGWRYEAIANWLSALARHCREHEVRVGCCPADVRDGDVALAVATADLYLRDLLDQHLVALAGRGVPFGVLHNNDGVPTPGRYPSFCWTAQAVRANRAYGPELVRMPVFGPLPGVDREMCPSATRVFTFGHLEPKKCVVEMALWARGAGLSFTVLTPNVLRGLYARHVKECWRAGASVVTHPWRDRVEDLASLVRPATHFLFVLPPSRGGAGGSPTSPRFAGLFGRPVVVVDDEDTYAQDRYHVFDSLGSIDPDALPGMRPPCYDWSPDAYVGHLRARVRDFWGEP